METGFMIMMDVSHSLGQLLTLSVGVFFLVPINVPIMLALFIILS